jgi:hypothetical protein
VAEQAAGVAEPREHLRHPLGHVLAHTPPYITTAYSVESTARRGLQMQVTI